MSAEELTALWTAAGVVVAILTGIGGLIYGFLGFREAQLARVVAEKANKYVAEKMERDIERHDVDWDWRWSEARGDHVIVQNIGKNLAKDVVAQFTINDITEVAQPAGDVDGRSTLEFAFDGLAEARMRAWVDAQVARFSTDPWTPHTVVIRLRVSWVTPLGTPKLVDTGKVLVELQGFEEPRLSD